MSVPSEGNWDHASQFPAPRHHAKDWMTSGLSRVPDVSVLAAFVQPAGPFMYEMLNDSSLTLCLTH